MVSSVEHEYVLQAVRDARPVDKLRGPSAGGGFGQLD